MGKNYWSMRYLAVGTLAVLALGSGTTCDIREGPDLTIIGPASELKIVTGGVPDLPTVLEFRVSVANASADAEGGNVDDFELACEMFASDDFGGNRYSHGRSTGQGALPAFEATDVLLNFQYQQDVPVFSKLFIECEVDPDNTVPENTEDNNKFNFLFLAYCIEGRPCPGPVQTGSSLSYTPWDRSSP